MRARRRAFPWKWKRKSKPSPRRKNSEEHTAIDWLVVTRGGDLLHREHRICANARGNHAHNEGFSDSSGDGAIRRSKAAPAFSAFALRAINRATDENREIPAYLPRWRQGCGRCVGPPRAAEQRVRI